jgi:hypothetical protein
MKTIYGTRRELRLALEQSLDENGITDRVVRMSLIECFEQDCVHDWNAAERAFAKGIKRALASGAETVHLTRSGKVAVVATPDPVYLAAGEEIASAAIPPLDFDDQADRDSLAELVEQKIRTAQRHGETLSFAAAAETIVKKFG